MNLSGISIRRPVAVSMVVVGILLLGFVSLEKIPLNLLPDITYPKITVRTEYPHAAPREVEERVTKLIESYVGIINNVIKVSSVSRPGWSDVYVEFTWGSDVDVIAMDIREKIQLLQNFLPEEVERPILLRYDPNQDPILTLAVGGDMDLADLRRWVEMNVELEIERLDGVAAVKIEGGYEDEILVEIDEGKLTRYGLRVSTISDRLKRENLNIASGSLEEGGAKLAVRTINRFTSLDDIRSVVVAERGGEASTGGASSAVASLSSGLSLGGMGMGGMGGMSGGGIPAGLLGLLGMGKASSSTGQSAATSTSRNAPIRVKDVADVHYQHKDRTEIARLNGKECIKVSVFKEGDANIVTVARAVRKAIDQVKDTHRAEPRSREWTDRLNSPARKLKILVNGVFNVLFNYRAFVIEDEPIELDNNIQIELISDQSVFITQSIMSVAQTAVWGSLIAVFILFVFLRNMSSTLIVGMAIPVSIITTFNLMFFNHISFNIMSLGGLALGVGMMVDNSIVVIENILRRRTFEPDPQVSAINGANEVSSAITAATLTNIMVFFPILYLEGMFRQIFGDLAWTVAFSLICSEAVALSLVPMLTVVLGKRVQLPIEMLDDLDLPPEARAARLKEIEEEKAQAGRKDDDGPRGLKVLKYRNYRAEREREIIARGEKPGCFSTGTGCLSYLVVLALAPAALLVGGAYKLSGAAAQALLKYPLQAFDKGFTWAKREYPRLLGRLLKRPYLVAGIAICLSAMSFYSLYLLGWELLPTVDQGEFRVNLELPTGTPIEKSNQRIAEIEDRIRATGFHHEIRSLFATVGIGEGEGEGSSEKAENIGEIHVALVDRDQRDVRDETIITKVMEALQTEVDLSARSSKPQLMSYKTPVEIEIEGTNLDRLDDASAMVIRAIHDVPGLLELKSSMAEQNPEVNITIDRTKAAALGLSVSDVTDVIRRKVKGETATEFDLPDQQIDVVVALTESDRNSPERLRRLIIPSSRGDIRLEQVASIKRALGPATITRSENSRVALITANIHDRPLGDVVGDIEARLNKITLPGGTFWRITGQNEEMKRSLPSLYLAIALAIALVYIVLAAQFESLLHPFVIMFCVPFSMIGFSAALIVTGETINLFSLIGMLMMIGIAVNDAIVFVTTINLRRDEGMKRDEAIIEAGRSRLRPILITSLTTIFGMVPMAIAFGPGAELRAPMAIAVIGGLMASTVLTLLVIPCLYLILDKILPRAYKPHAVHVETTETLAAREHHDQAPAPQPE